jgi:3-methyladenine DNA glycosylase AlkD
MTAATLRRPTSATTARAHAFVAGHLEAATALGRDVAELTADPETLTAELEAGFRGLADEEYREGQQFVAPGLGPVLGVRSPLLSATGRAFGAATRSESPARLLQAADRLLRARPLELHWFAFGLLDRLVRVEPERSWQLLRRAARDAADWITVDTLAHAAGRGVLLEAYRWAELEQLVYAPSRWERRLVGSTIATIPFIDHRLGREPVVAARGLAIIGELIGDAEPDVQKALSWALRSLAIVDAQAVERFCRAEADTARASEDGHRAWVVRDALSKLDASAAAEIRASLDGIRRRPGAESTSRASQIAASFAGLGLGRRMPEPPLT